MQENTGSPSCSKRTQKDYSLAFKLQVVDEVEKGLLTQHQAQSKYGIQGTSTILAWLRKHGTLDWKKTNPMKGKLTPHSKIKELERKIKRLEQEKVILNKAIDIADEMFDTNIRKKFLPLSQAAFDSQGQQKSEAPEL
jgi:transposase